MITMERIPLWLTASAGAVSIGAALFVGAGFATADTETHRSTTTSQSSDNSGSSEEQSAKTSAAEHDRSNSSKRVKAETKPETDATEKAPEEEPRRFGAKLTGHQTVSDATAEAEPVEEPAVRETVRVTIPSSKEAAPPLRERTVHVSRASVPEATVYSAPVEVQAAQAVTAAALPAPVAVTVKDSALTLAPNVTVDADWFIPAVTAPRGVVFLQHGYTRDNVDISALAKAIAGQTGSLVVAPLISSSSSNPYWIRGTATPGAIAALFGANIAALTASAVAAGYTRPLPSGFVLAGHSAGGNLVSLAGGAAAGNSALKGVLLLDAFNYNSDMVNGITKIPSTVPVYSISAEPCPCNGSDSGTKALRQARPGAAFIGVRMVRGEHIDAEGTSGDLVGKLVCGFPRSGYPAALQTIAAGYVFDMLSGYAWDNPNRTGVYPAAGVTIQIGTAPVVKLG